MTEPRLLIHEQSASAMLQIRKMSFVFELQAFSYVELSFHRATSRPGRAAQAAARAAQLPLLSVAGAMASLPADRDRRDDRPDDRD